MRVFLIALLAAISYAQTEVPICSMEDLVPLMSILSQECINQVVITSMSEKNDVKSFSCVECTCYMELTPEDFLQATGVDSNSCGFGSGFTVYDERGMCEQNIDALCEETTETPTNGTSIGAQSSNVTSAHEGQFLPTCTEGQISSMRDWMMEEFGMVDECYLPFIGVTLNYSNPLQEVCQCILLLEDPFTAPNVTRDCSPDPDQNATLLDAWLNCNSTYERIYSASSESSTPESFLKIAALVIMTFWIIICAYIISDSRMDYIEKRRDILVWFRGSFASFDFFSDLGFIFDTWSTIYGHLLLSILLICCLKSFLLLIYRAPKLLHESLVQKWKRKAFGDWRIVGALWIFTGLSPVFYDLLLTSVIDFPIHLANRWFIYKEKLLHICAENVLSICVVSLYVANEDSHNSIAIISLISSIFMSILILFAGGCEFLLSQEAEQCNYASAIITLRKEDLNSAPSKRKLQKKFEGLLDVNCIVTVWYILESKCDYQVYCHIKMQDQMQIIDEVEIGKSLIKVLDILELPTRKSIQIDIHNTNAPRVDQMIKWGFDDTLYSTADVGGDFMSSNSSRAEYIKLVTGNILSETTELESNERVYDLGDGKYYEFTNDVYADMDPGPDPMESLEFLSNEDCESNLDRIVGKGNFGKVFAGSYHGAECAFKRSQDIRAYASESVLFEQVSRHPNICGYFGIYRHEDSITFLVMEYFPDGSLLDVIQTFCFSNTKKLKFCLDLTKALWHLHAFKVLHGDLSLRNVLVDTGKMRAVLSDFGQSCRHPCQSTRGILSPRWSSPELMRTRMLTFESEIWAIGVTFWEIFSDGRKPYLHLKGNEVVSRLMEGNLYPKIDESWIIAEILERIFATPKSGASTIKSAKTLHDCIKNL